MPHPVIHFEIATEDPQALGAFYREMFGWDIAPFSQPDQTMQYLIARPYANDDPERGINGGIGSTPESGDHVTFYIHVNDVPAALEKIEKLGGKRLSGPDYPPGMVVATFQDPQGHTIGLVDPQM